MWLSSPGSVLIERNFCFSCLSFIQYESVNGLAPVVSNLSRHLLIPPNPLTHPHTHPCPEIIWRASRFQLKHYPWCIDQSYSFLDYIIFVEVFHILLTWISVISLFLILYFLATIIVLLQSDVGWKFFDITSARLRTE